VWGTRPSRGSEMQIPAGLSSEVVLTQPRCRSKRGRFDYILRGGVATSSAHQQPFAGSDAVKIGRNARVPALFLFLPIPV
jgi:hypothetical protein